MKYIIHILSITIVASFLVSSPYDGIDQKAKDKLAKYDIEKAFFNYQKLRKPKACQVVKASWMIGKLAHFSNPFAIRARNILMQMIPSIANRKQFEAIFRLNKLEVLK